MTSTQRVEKSLRRPPEGDGRPVGGLSLPAVGGIAGPNIFTLAFVVQGLLRGGEYSPSAETVCALEAGP